jgi:hypothetical protein
MSTCGNPRRGEISSMLYIFMNHVTSGTTIMMMLMEDLLADDENLISVIVSTGVD